MTPGCTKYVYGYVYYLISKVGIISKETVVNSFKFKSLPLMTLILKINEKQNSIIVMV